MTAESYLYGLEHASHDFTEEKSFGKNIFTNAFPISLAIYMSCKRNIDPNYIAAGLDAHGNPEIRHTLRPLEDIVGAPIDQAFWAFEDSFAGYDIFATEEVNRSDLVVRNLKTDEETRAFEVKLVAAPTSGTAKKPREMQSCEIVVRPPTIEQMCFSIASSYGIDRRHEIGDMIAAQLEHPMDYQWTDEVYMLDKLPQVLSAAEEIISEGIDSQTPFVLNALWRTKGTSTVFDDECFDVFFWSDLAFLQLFTKATRKALNSGASKIGRPARSVIWLVKSLFDYAAQGTVTFEKTHSLITYGGQTDKAGAFSGSSVLSLIGCENFYHPRIRSEEYRNIITPDGVELLSPERRLDGFIKTDFDYRTVDYQVVPFDK